MSEQKTTPGKWGWVWILLIIAAFLIILELALDLIPNKEAGEEQERGEVATVEELISDQSSMEQVQQIMVREDVQSVENYEQKARITTEKGDIVVGLASAAAPRTVSNFINLIEEQFYSGVTVHRVVPGFVIQAGDPITRTEPNSRLAGTGGPGYTFADEINPESLGLSASAISALEAEGYTYRDDVTSLRNTVGALSMANSGPDTNGSQFFIITEEAQPHLDGRHTVFGMVEQGLDVVAQLAQGDRINAITIE